MTSPWPWPGDTQLARARRVAHAYRARLLEAAPDACAELDALMHRWGQAWAIPKLLTVAHADDYVTAAEAADLACCTLDRIRQLRQSGRLPGERISERKYRYRVGDIMALGTKTRERGGDGGQ